MFATSDNKQCPLNVSSGNGIELKSKRVLQLAADGARGKSAI